MVPGNIYKHSFEYGHSIQNRVSLPLTHQQQEMAKWYPVTYTCTHISIMQHRTMDGEKDITQFNFKIIK